MTESNRQPFKGTCTGVCFDTSALIDLVDAQLLDEIGKWFPNSAYTASAVVNQELQPSLPTYPQNKKILEASWLHVRALEVEDDQLRRLRILYGARRGKGQGEAEVLALCARHAWTAVINDTAPRNGANLVNPRVHALCTPELFVAAAAHDVISVDESWEMHKTVHRKHRKSLLGLGTEQRFETVFKRLIDQVRENLPAGHEWPANLRQVPRFNAAMETWGAGAPLTTEAISASARRS